MRGLRRRRAIHLLHQHWTYNAPFARGLLRGQPHLIHLWRRGQGQIVSPGNPAGITIVRDLAGLRVVERHPGPGPGSSSSGCSSTPVAIQTSFARPNLGIHLDVALAGCNRNRRRRARCSQPLIEKLRTW